MTDTEVLNLIREDFQGVKDSVNGLSGKISGMESTVSGIEKTLDRHEKDIKETHDAQLSCKASGGWVTLNREIKIAREKQNGYQERIRGELQDLRGDQTGQHDVPVVVAVEKRSSALVVLGLIKALAPWVAMVAAILFVLGVLMGSGGDKEATLKVLEEFGFRLGKIEARRAEPIRVPVPVSSERFSEEIVFRDPP